MHFGKFLKEYAILLILGVLSLIIGGLLLGLAGLIIFVISAAFFIKIGQKSRGLKNSLIYGFVGGLVSAAPSALKYLPDNGVVVYAFTLLAFGIIAGALSCIGNLFLKKK